MTIEELLSKIKELEPVTKSDFSREIKSVYCCDLLSIVMGRAPADCAWITVMGNLNAVAVSVLADMSLIVIAENAPIDKNAIEKAIQQDVNIVKTRLPIFETGKLIDGVINV